MSQPTGAGNLSRIPSFTRRPSALPRSWVWSSRSSSEPSSDGAAQRMTELMARFTIYVAPRGAVLPGGIRNARRPVAAGR